MNVNNTKDLEVFITLFVHYPETYIPISISNNFNRFFLEKNIFGVICSPKCYAEIKSAPHCEKEEIKIEIILDKNNDTVIEKDKLIVSLNNYIEETFKDKIKVINILFLTK